MTSSGSASRVDPRPCGRYEGAMCPPAAQQVCVTPRCTVPTEPGRDHCPEHHARRQTTWAAGAKDYRDRQKARTRLLEQWARLLHDTIAPATGAAYEHNDAAMDAAEQLNAAITAGDDQATDQAFAALADALNQTRAALVEANKTVMDMERATGPLAHVIDPPPRPRENRATREERERQFPQ